MTSKIGNVAEGTASAAQPDPTGSGDADDLPTVEITVSRGGVIYREEIIDRRPESER